MTQTITLANQQNIEHCLLIDMFFAQEGGTQQTELNFITGVNSITYQGRTYNPLGGFLGISDIQNTLQNSADEMTITLSGIPDNYIPSIMDYKIKGGEVNIYRAFLDANRTIQTANIYSRFRGIIVNYSINEEVNTNSSGAEVNYTISVICSSIFGVLENRISGRRTNQKDYNIVYKRTNAGVKTNELYITDAITTDPSMDRVVALFNAAFDFGKEYKGTAAQSTGGSGGSYDVDTYAQDTSGA